MTPGGSFAADPVDIAKSQKIRLVVVPLAVV